MRISTSAAVLTLGGSLVLGLAMSPVAQAAPRDAAGTCSMGAFGIAAHYSEFVLGDDTHTPDAEAQSRSAATPTSPAASASATN
ncbi:MULTISPECIES: hypothetical protein [unclassified Streptomyces]|uniref:hypothetical protein n=1 Tax=unclassified Streptomyces TaxID=2593676 RepID=UPI00365735E6